MTHEAGKGDTMRPTNHKTYADNFDRIFSKPDRPQNCGTSFCSCIECLMKDGKDCTVVFDECVDENEEPTCPSCNGPMYTQPHWGYLQCDDCGRREDKEVDV